MRNVVIRIKQCVACLLIASGSLSAVADNTRQTNDEYVNSIINRDETIATNVWDSWKLTEREWDRYEEILAKSPWGIWTHEATPLAILAHYSSSSNEKSRYARIEAELDQWRKHLAVSYQQFYNREREVVDAAYKNYITNRVPVVNNIVPADTIAFFVKSRKCGSRCKAVVKRLMATQAKINIYVVDAKDQKAVFDWAESANIPPERVQLRQITLNFNKDEFTKVSQVPLKNADIPSAYLKVPQSEQYRRIEQL